MITWGIEGTFLGNQFSFQTRNCLPPCLRHCESLLSCIAPAAENPPLKPETHIGIKAWAVLPHCRMEPHLFCILHELATQGWGKASFILEELQEINAKCEFLSLFGMQLSVACQT